MITFKEYLIKKKIDFESFKKNDLSLFINWEQDFKTYNEDSFTMQKKFSLNKIRRQYLLKNE